MQLAAQVFRHWLPLSTMIPYTACSTFSFPKAKKKKKKKDPRKTENAPYPFPHLTIHPITHLINPLATCYPILDQPSIGLHRLSHWLLPLMIDAHHHTTQAAMATPKYMLNVQLGRKVHLTSRNLSRLQRLTRGTTNSSPQSTQSPLNLQHTQYKHNPYSSSSAVLRPSSPGTTATANTLPYQRSIA